MTTKLYGGDKRLYTAAHNPDRQLYSSEDGSSHIEISPEGELLTICKGGKCSAKPLKDWVKMSTDGYDDNKFIDAMWQAIDWHFGPSDREKVRSKWRELVFKAGDPL